MRVRPTPILLALVAMLSFALAVPAAAQGHSHEPTHARLLVSPLGTTGTTTVGAANGFTVLSQDGEGVPRFHQDMPLRITLNGKVVFETDAESGHDYDGVQTVWIVFAEPGRYLVEALDVDGGPAATYEGEVLPEPDGSWDSRWDPTVGLLVGAFETTLVFAETDGARERDAWADVRLGDRLVSTATLHAADGSPSWLFAATGPGTFEPNVVGFDARPPTRGIPAAAELIGTYRTINLGNPAPSTLPVLPPDLPPMESNAVVTGTVADGKRILGTYDPWTSVGTETLQHLAVLVVDDETHVPVAEVAFTASIVDAVGHIVWASNDILEHDGIFEASSLQQTPGIYTLVAEASAGTWSGSIRMPWRVTPPVEVEQPNAGAVTLTPTLPATLRAGEPVTFSLAAADSAGAAFAHTDVVLDVIGPSPIKEDPPLTAIVLRAKLHNHDGSLSATISFPTAGNYTLLFSPSPLEARAVTMGSDPGRLGTRSLAVHVEPGAPPSTTEDADPANRGSQPTPVPFVVALAGLALALLLRRR